MKNHLGYIALLVSFLTLGCKKEKPFIRIGALGDSITQGVPSANMPDELESLVPGDYKVSNYGVGGTCLVKNCFAPIWETEAFSKLLKDKPSIIVIMLGTNDVHGLNSAVMANFENDYRDMIDLFQGLDSNPRIVLCYSPPLFQLAPISDSLVKVVIIPIIDHIAEDYHLEVADTHYMVDDYPAHYPDDLHPDIEGAFTLAKIIAATLNL
ncbi:MAG: hypothetical protein K9J37_08825 [Saprospiraceae bacterium]|nr:hypothetical protein [Saprospiraceae bacterium]MCF8250004.1 hypothetical protein [Saprospiraceae bacterium]MCF8278956.1 hypothetical protein [Bacteroidales bacterium]MCF8311017.1 hypothetical protein [Saprospiraceae bacterium]MCF8439647.1 hypothetical protein [Saprospiraceae bacterium]